MDEIEYKLNTNNSVLVVNAVDKLISVIKSKYKPGERQKFVLENEELKFLRDKCSSKDSMVSLTACQGLLALVELGVLEIGHTMSTVVTLLPSAHNYSAIISTMAGLLTLDLKSRLIPGQPYTCQFSLRSPQHPFITVLERNKGAKDEVITQMHALCTHPDYTISSNSLELLRPVFLWLTCSPECDVSLRAWQLLLSLPQSSGQCELLLACVSCQQICNPKLIERAFAAYCAVTETAIYQQNRDYVMALLPMLARISNELIKHGLDPRTCYSLIERCFSLDAPQLRSVAGLTLTVLAQNLSTSSALYLHELFNLCLNIISKYEYSTLSLCTFTALSLQWLHLPSYLTSSALKISSKIIDIYQNIDKEDSRLHIPNLKTNKTFMSLLYTDSHLSVVFQLNQTWERIRDDEVKLRSWFDCLEAVKDEVLLESLPFLLGIVLLKRKERWFEEFVLRSIRIATELVNLKKEVSVHVMPVLLYKIANDPSPAVKLECLRALPLMAKTKENVPTIVSILNKLKANKGVPTSFLIMLYTSLAETQVRCFPYLQEILADTSTGRPDDLKWEVDVARAMAVKRICEIRASTHGLELVSIISSILNKCTDKAGAPAASLAIQALVYLWRGAAVAPPSTWRALEPKLGKDSRPAIQISICKLLAEIPSLRVSTPEYDKLMTSTSRTLWGHVAQSSPDVVEAACDALSRYKRDDYTLNDIPEIYRRTVKLPASYCKTPADAARKPEEVLDYIPCEVWPEVYKYTNQAALPAVERFVSRLVDREIRTFRSGVYQRDARVEPPSVSYLQPSCVVRGLLECFRRQAMTPSYDYPDTVLLSIADTLSADYPKPLPPLDLTFLHELFHRGAAWKERCAKLAARQSTTSGSARRLLENYLQGVASGSAEEADINLVFDLLPILCRGMPPNTLRPVLEKSLGEAYMDVVNVKVTDNKYEDSEEKPLFIRQLEKIRECLECERIHDANRTLLSQIVENYFSVIDDDNVAWPTYIEIAKHLSTTYLERATCPSSWWEVTSTLVRKCTELRSRVCACVADCTAPLVWLNDVIDVNATHVTEQEYSLQCMLPALKAASVDDVTTREWFLQLMARTQVAFNEMADESSKQYLCAVFTLSVLVFSTHWRLEAGSGPGEGAHRLALLPAAAAALVARPAWTECSLQMLEWLSHTSARSRDARAASSCRLAVLALRHTDAFHTQQFWKRLESHFGKNTAVDD